MVPQTARSHARKVWTWLGPCASFVCLIHCFGTGLVAAFAPGLLKLFPHSESLEWSVLAVSTFSGSMVLRKQNAARSLWIVLYVSALAAAAGLLEHTHSVFHFALLILAILPTGLLVARHYHARKTPACCDHDHG